MRPYVPFCALSLILAAAAACFGQAGDDPHSINGYPSNPEGYYIYPGNKIIFQHCVAIVDPQNPLDWIPVPNIQVQVSVYGWNGTGWHGHEITGTQRPYATFLSPNPSPTTAINGCAAFSIALPKFSGWYTIDTSSVTGRSGINIYLKYWVGPQTAPVFLVNYPNNLKNKPQSFHTDTHHNSASRYFIPNVVTQIQAASQRYYSDTLNNYGIPDLLDITRGSLPDGGSADNEGPGFSPDGETYYPNWTEWSVRSFETHSQGVEVDVFNPLWLNDLDHEHLAVQAMAANNCVLGAKTEWGGSFPAPGDGPLGYWGGKDVMHFVCRANSLIKY